MDLTVVRTTPAGEEAVLRDLLSDYFVEVQDLSVEYFEELSGFDVEGAVEADLQRLRTAAIDEPLFLARRDRAVGTVQLKRLDPTTAEVKRLYVVPDRRGEGIGRGLMERVVDEAATDGFETLRLGVAPFLDRAQALYEDLGFEYTPRYGESGAPEAVSEEWGFMRLDLE